MQDITFKARFVSNYTVLNNNLPAKLDILKLEPKDYHFVDRFIRNIDENDVTSRLDISKKVVMREAFLDLKDLLIKQKVKDDKIYKNSVSYLAVCEDKSSGLLIANLPKIDINKDDIHYSSRKNHGKNETELDWLVSWAKSIKGIGRALVTEYFLNLKKFKQVYLRSVVPENSYAFDFYKTLGFQQIGERNLNYKYANNIDLIHGNYEDSSYLNEIIPMLIRKKRINKIVGENVLELNRQNGKNISVTLY